MTAFTNSSFTAPDGNRYFRRNALEVGVGVWGEKKQPLTEANYLAAMGSIRSTHLDGKISKSVPMQIDWSHESTTAVEASAKLYFVAGGTATFTHSRAKEAQLKIVRFFVYEETLRRVLNDDADLVRAGMKKEGGDARVCSSALGILDGHLADRFATSVGLEVSGTLSTGLSITAKGGASWQGSETITFSPGTLLAYGLHKVKKWDGDTIRELEDDKPGLN